MIFDFQPTDHGPVWVHAYPFSDSLSTFVVECSIATYQSWGYGQSNIETDVRNIESIFENILDGNKLRWLQNHPKQWRTFKQITTTHVNSDDNVVLMGDAANTAHFSIGCGTKLAVDDAIALNRSLGEHTNLLSALKAFGENRKAQTLDIQAVALRSMRWFENADSLMSVPFDNFIRSFMFRSFEPRKISPRDMVSI
jgi:anthraniloyl-CoA monooxygenase